MESQHDRPSVSEETPRPASASAISPDAIDKSPDWKLAAAIARLAFAATRALEAETRSIDLTSMQIQALYFARFTRPQLATVGNLARVLGVSHVTVIRAVRPLIERGYLRRETGVDRRTTILVATELGCEVLEATIPRWLGPLLRVVASLSPIESRAMENILCELTHLISDEIGLARFGICSSCKYLEVSPVATKRCRRLDLPVHTCESGLACPLFAPKRDFDLPDHEHSSQS